MKRIVLFVIFVVIALISYRSISSDSLTKSLRSLERNTATYNLANHTDFNWDKVYLFSPYQSNSEVNKTLGINWNGYENYNLSTNDGGTLFVFVKNNTVIRAEETYWRFSCPKEGLNKTDATFRNSLDKTNTQFICQ